MTDEPPPDPPATPPLAHRLFGGVVWMTSMRWAMRLLGLISTSILARLLTPADFGLVAMATSVTALVSIITDLGVDTALVRDKDAGKEQFNTAWTLRLMQMAVVALVVVVLAPFAADYYQEPRIRNVLWVAALTLIMIGCENIGIVEFRRQLEFKKDFRYNLITKLAGVTGTIVLALVLRSYWALVLGGLITSTSRVILSYTLHPYRPRFSLTAFRELWGVSQWLLLRGVGMAINRQADIFVLGRLTTPHILGQYNVSRDLANMVSAELTAPTLRTLMPGMSQIIGQPARLRPAILKSLGALATIGLPASAGFALVAGELVPLLLGDQWGDAIPLLRLFAIASLSTVITLPGANLCLLMKDMRFITLESWGSAIIRLALIIPAYMYAGISGAAAVSIVVQACSAVIMGWRICLLSDTGILEFFSVLVRPLVATGLMVAAVLGTQSLYTATTSQEQLILLVAEILVGALIYTVAVLASWTMQSKPDGLETHVVRYMAQALSKLNR